eukprot:7854958-Lingulodinium_polyedra.AAC.1
MFVAALSQDKRSVPRSQNKGQVDLFRRGCGSVHARVRSFAPVFKPVCMPKMWTQMQSDAFARRRRRRRRRCSPV